MQRRAMTVMVSSAASALALAVGPAAATEGPGGAQAPPADTRFVDALRVVDTPEGDYLLDESFTLDGRPLSTQRTPLDGSAGTEPSTLAKRGGTGGTSTASGCRKVTISNRAKTVVGKTAYRYNTWTRWCWTRSSERIHRGVKTGWSISSVDGFQYWRGQVRKVTNFYDAGANNNRPRSGFRHYRQGRFENCVVKYGCIQTSYPANSLRSYSNGRYRYAFSGT